MSDYRVSYSVDGVNLNDAAGRWFLNPGTRRRSLPAVRATNVSTPGRHGDAFIPGDTYASSSLVLALTVTASNAAGVMLDGPAGRAQVEENLEFVSALFADTARLLRVEQHIAPGVSRVAYGRVSAGSEPELVGIEALEFRLTFVVEVPAVFWSDGAGSKVVQGPAPAASGAFPLPVLAGGSAPVTDAVIRFAGPFNGRCSVRDVGGGAAYAWTGTPDASPSTKTTAAGTITNMFPNPSFEAGISGWNRFASTLEQSNEHAYAGTKSVKVTAASLTSYAGDIRAGNSGTMTYGVIAGETYTMKAWVFYPKEHALIMDGAESRQRRILAFTSAGAGTIPNFGPQAPNTAGWHELTHTFTVPIDTVGVIVGIGCAGSESTLDRDFETFVGGARLSQGEHTVFEYFDGSTPSTAGMALTGLDFQGTVAAGTYVFLNAETLRAHTSTNPESWDTGTDVSGNLDYPPAGPLQITPSAQTDGTHYAVAYTLPAAKNVADAIGVRAERKFI